jgi:hypothetical protein
MTFQSRPLEARPRNWANADPRSSRVKGRNHKPVPEYEKPLVKTEEARLWLRLNSGDRVEVVHKEKYSKRGTVDTRTCDGNTVWIILDQGMGRIAVTDGDPVALVPV